MTTEDDMLKRTLMLVGEFSELPTAGVAAFDASVTKALSRLGEFLTASRAYVMYGKPNGGPMKVTHEWTGHAVSASGGAWSLANNDSDAVALRTLLMGQKVLRRAVWEMPDGLRESLQKRGVESILWAPLIRNGMCVGLAGFDNCGTERVWREEEGSLLRVFADMMALLIEQRELRSLKKKLSDIFGILERDAESADHLLSSWRDITASAPMTLREAERQIITETLKLYNGNKLRAAKHLGLTWPSLDRRCKKLGVAVSRM